MSFFDLIKESAIHVRFRPGWEAIGKSGDGASCVVRGTFGETPPLGSYAPEFESGNQGLAAGTPLAALRDAVIQNAGAQQAATYMLLLQRLARFGLIEFPLVDSEGEHAVALPQWNTFTPALASEVPCEGRQLVRFAFLDDRHNLSSIDGLPALEVAFAPPGAAHVSRDGPGLLDTAAALLEQVKFDKNRRN